MQVGMEQEERTWTNERLEQLQGHGGISEFNQLPEPRSEVTREVAAEEQQPGLALPYDRLQGTRWYSERAAEMQSQLQALQLELVRYQTELQLVRSLRAMEAGLAFKQDTVGITPEAGIDVRIALLRGLRGQLEDLEDLARRNSILPGVLR